MLGNLGLTDDGPDQTKWIRLFNALSNAQNKHSVGNHTVQLINAVMRPEAYLARPELFKSRQTALNQVLSFAGFRVLDDGRVGHTVKATTLDEALARAGRLEHQLRTRGVHPKVLAFCRAELVQSNYFHAVLEAMKSLKVRINELARIDGDGASLIEAAFGLSQGRPLLAINGLRNQTDEGEQKGFAQLLKGLFGMIRNPLAHHAKLEWDMPEQDALDILTTLSFVHRKLDIAHCHGTH